MDELQEYYLLYYDEWVLRNDNSICPTLTYCISLGSLSVEDMENLAKNMGVFYLNKFDQWETHDDYDIGPFADKDIRYSEGEFFVPPDSNSGYYERDEFQRYSTDDYDSFYIIQPRQDLPGPLQAACACAMQRFREDSQRGIAPNSRSARLCSAIKRMLDVVRAAQILRNEVLCQSEGATDESRGRVIRKKTATSGTRPKQAPTQGKVHNALVIFLTKRPDAAQYTAVHLAEILASQKPPIKCSKSAIIGTAAWATYCRPFRRREKTISLEDPGKIQDYMSENDKNDGQGN